MGDATPHAKIASTEWIPFFPVAGVVSGYLAHFLRQSPIRDFLARTAAGVGGSLMRVKATTLRDLQFDLAPLPEQDRIVDTLDELFSALDAGVAELQRVRDKLSRYRASVLKAAVEGALTADWREANASTEPAEQLLERILVERRATWEKEQLAKFAARKQLPPLHWKARYRPPVEPRRSGLSPLPNMWYWSSLDQVGVLDRGKSRHRPRDAAFLYGGPYPFVQTGDVRKARQYLRQFSQTYSEAGLAQSRLWKPDTLCITIAANIAETAILSFDACFPDSVVGVVFNADFVSVRYVELFLRHAKTRIAAYAPATAQKNINNDILRLLAVPLPPIEEQAAIVEIVEAHLSVLDHLEDDLTAKIKAAGSLRQSILRHAFAGKLVHQDPSDEPASELIKRIAEQRKGRSHAASKPKAAKRPRKAKRT